MGVLPIATDVWGETTKFPLRFCHLLISTMCAMNSCQLDLFFKTVFSWWRRVFVLPKAFRCAAYSMVNSWMRWRATLSVVLSLRRGLVLATGVVARGLCAIFERRSITLCRHGETTNARVWQTLA